MKTIFVKSAGKIKERKVMLIGFIISLIIFSISLGISMGKDNYHTEGYMIVCGLSLIAIIIFGCLAFFK
jgi:predicted transporter